MLGEKLTPRELRLIALILGGLSPEEVESSLGIPREVVSENIEAIRGKIEALDDEGIQDAVQRKLANTLVAIGTDDLPAEQVATERREKLLLRLTIKELLRVAADADLRAAMLEATIDNIGSISESEARREIEDLRECGHLVRQVSEDLLQRVRGRSSIED